MDNWRIEKASRLVPQYVQISNDENTEVNRMQVQKLWEFKIIEVQIQERSRERSQCSTYQTFARSHKASYW